MWTLAFPLNFVFFLLLLSSLLSFLFGIDWRAGNGLLAAALLPIGFYAGSDIFKIGRLRDIVRLICILNLIVDTRSEILDPHVSQRGKRREFLARNVSLKAIFVATFILLKAFHTT